MVLFSPLGSPVLPPSSFLVDFHLISCHRAFLAYHFYERDLCALFLKPNGCEKDRIDKFVSMQAKKKKMQEEMERISGIKTCGFSFCEWKELNEKKGAQMEHKRVSKETCFLLHSKASMN